MFRLVRSRQALEREGVTVIDRAHPLDRLDLAEDERLGGGVVEVVAACDFEHIGVLGDHPERLEPFGPSDHKRLVRAYPGETTLDIWGVGECLRAQDTSGDLLRRGSVNATW